MHTGDTYGVTKNRKKSHLYFCECEYKHDKVKDLFTVLERV